MFSQLCGEFVGKFLIIFEKIEKKGIKWRKHGANNAEKKTDIVISRIEYPAEKEMLVKVVFDV